MFTIRHFVMLSLVMAAAATRLFPHPPNFTAVGAISVFAGVYFSRRWTGIAIPLAALLISDLGLSLMWYGGSKWSFAPIFTYALFAFTAVMGMAIRQRPSFGRLMTTSVLAAVVFFVVSNWHVWFAGSGRLYPHTAEGLLACYIAALPFALNMVVSNVFYCGVLFAAWRLVEMYVPASQPSVAGELSPASLKS
jgi:hypothetical protein